MKINFLDLLREFKRAKKQKKYDTFLTESAVFLFDKSRPSKRAA